MSTALYRRYRPETFADVIGQEHVTDPLMAAIEKGRVNHAYLFSGPRGCGKTTSARILARCLNCAQGPTPTPCGVCDSCVELARNGSGSLDVIEIDAASHGGVDDARDLRERATFAPVRDRYKIFIIDEAHMVTSAGFNALLKIVEEPPEHILFIFATTEPDKVIGTIRSRTHHYPFRLVPQEPLMGYLELLCRQENVPVAPGVLSLVVRAGGGSVRDSLSVLDQLMAGAGESGVDYELAVSLLGYTHATLLDDVVDAVAAGDAATVFTAVDRVIQTGHDPRRFVEDLLERFRDLIVINAVPEGAAAVLRGVPEDQLHRMRTQANQLGAGELSRAADITNTALTEMTGATSPRLHLELLCARLLLPAADESVRGTLARVDRIERRLAYAGTETAPAASAAPAAPAASPAPAGPAAARAALQRPAGPGPTSGAPEVPQRPASAPVPETAAKAPEPRMPAAVADATGSASAPAPAEPAPAASSDWGHSWGGEAPTPEPEKVVPTEQTAPTKQTAPNPQPAPAKDPAPAQTAAEAPAGAGPATPAAAPASGGSSGGGAGQIEMVRRAWPEIMDELAKIKRITWLNVNVDAKPRALEGNRLVLAFATPGNAIAFQRGPHMDNVRQAIQKVLGLDCVIEAILDGPGRGESDPKVPASRPAPAKGSTGSQPAPQPGPASAPPAVSAAPAVPAVSSISPGHAGPEMPGTVVPPLTPAATVEGNRGSGSNQPPAVQTGTTARPAGPLPTGTTAQPAGPLPTGTTAQPARPLPTEDGPTAGGGVPPRVGLPDRAAPASGQPRQAENRAAVESRRSADTDIQPTENPQPGTPRVSPVDSGAPGPTKSAAPAAPVTPVAPAMLGGRGHAPRPSPVQAAGQPAGGPPSKPSPPAEPEPYWQQPDPDDDSWAMIEPPEDAFDPGPGRRSGAPLTPAPVQAQADAAQSQGRVQGKHAPLRQAPVQTPVQALVQTPVQAPAPTPTPSEKQPPVRHAPPPSERLGTGRDPQPQPATAAPSGKPISRYQRLLDEAARKEAEAAAAGKGAVELRYVEDVPSADDETIEETGLVGRSAIERILNGRLVEERRIDAQ